jgi:flavin reductase (DIM6/NTAB) family NADH-FMN oxidoreductase RutF
LAGDNSVLPFAGKPNVEIEPSALSALELYQHMTRLIAPRPIAWVSTQSVDGRTNLAPFSYFTAVGSNPPTLAFCPANRADGTAKDTLANVEQTGEFVVNVVSFDLANEMNQSSADYDTHESEFEACGIQAMPSLRVRPPRVAEAKAHLECRLHSVVKLGTGPGGANLVIGRIVAMYIDDQILDETGHADPTLLDLVSRMGGSTYARATDRFDLDRPNR